MIHFMLQREVRKLLAEGKIASYEKGEIVVKLMAEQQVSEEEALAAAATCDNIDTALQMLQQECQLCMNVMKITEVIEMNGSHGSRFQYLLFPPFLGCKHAQLRSQVLPGLRQQAFYHYH